MYPPGELCTLMKKCDYVAAALPFTPATEKFIDREAIQCLKPSAVFINVGRGKTVDEDALVEGQLVLHFLLEKSADIWFTEHVLPSSITCGNLSCTRVLHPQPYSLVGQNFRSASIHHVHEKIAIDSQLLLNVSQNFLEILSRVSCLIFLSAF